MINYVFKRYELKYVINEEIYYKIISEIKNHLVKEEYKEQTIQSLYYDTDDYLIIRNSIEGEAFKEKLRIRSYGLYEDGKILFLEIKRKYDGIVSKRRIAINNALDLSYDNKTQIGKEIDYFKSVYSGIKPKCLLLYDREAYGSERELRITFDRNVRFRIDDLTLSNTLGGNRIINEGTILMEIKIPDAMPLWLVKLLSDNKIYKSSFSKYKRAYEIIKNKEELVWMNYSNQSLVAQK